MSRFASGFAVLLLTVFCCNAAGQQPDKAPAPELVQYVRDAKRAGMKDNRIEQDATKAGWPAADVKQAIAYVHSNPKTDKNGSSKGEVEPQRAGSNAAGLPATGLSAPAASALTASPESRSNTPAAKPEPAGGTPAKTADPATGGGPKAVEADSKAGDAKPEDAAGGARPRPNRQASDEYQIGEGDVLSISVYGERDASVPSVVVRPDGNISMPLLKDVYVEGLTPPQLEKKITTLLEPMFKAPDVTVIMMQNNSKKIYITGAVKKEGPIPYTYRMTILQAISEAGGVTEYAKRKKIYVLHNDGGQQYKYDFDYDAVLKGLHMEQNIELQPGDTIVVPH